MEMKATASGVGATAGSVHVLVDGAWVGSCAMTDFELGSARGTCSETFMVQAGATITCVATGVLVISYQCTGATTGTF